MQDENSLIVTYRAWRGETRGKHKAGQSWEGRGDCIDCNSCVAVCPTGIDIRDGQQLECIGCGLCIDACDTVMDKVGRPRKLIAFDTLANQAARAAGGSAPYHWLRPRTAIYGAMLVAVGGLMLAGLATRADVELTVLRDRAPLFVTLSDGSTRNAYTVKVLNKARAERRFELAVDGLPRAALQVAGGEAAAPATRIALAARSDAVATFRVLVTLPADAGAPESTPIAFALAERGRPATRHDSVFLAPGH
jgi:cytochrome c oxidase accessory protein FixG